MTKSAKRLMLAGILYGASMGLSSAQETVTSPTDQFGHQVGDDYKLINYTQFEAYIKKLERRDIDS